MNKLRRAVLAGVLSAGVLAGTAPAAHASTARPDTSPNTCGVNKNVGATYCFQIIGDNQTTFVTAWEGSINNLSANTYNSTEVQVLGPFSEPNVFATTDQTNLVYYEIFNLPPCTVAIPWYYFPTTTVNEGQSGAWYRPGYYLAQYIIGGVIALNLWHHVHGLNPYT